MEEGIRRLIEAVTAAQEDYHEHVIYIELLKRGIRCRIVWQVGQNSFSEENITPWREIHQSPNNPLISALDELVKLRTEHPE